MNVSKNVESIEDEEEEKIDGPNCVSDGSVYDMDCTVSDNRTEVFLTLSFNYCRALVKCRFIKILLQLVPVARGGR